jgi:hypothetical protein
MRSLEDLYFREERLFNQQCKLLFNDVGKKGELVKGLIVEGAGVITSQDQIDERLYEYYQLQFGKTGPKVEPAELKTQLDLFTVDNIMEAIKQVKGSKAEGNDYLNIDLLKGTNEDSNLLLEKLIPEMLDILNGKNEIPEYFNLARL